MKANAHVVKPEKAKTDSVVDKTENVVKGSSKQDDIGSSTKKAGPNAADTLEDIRDLLIRVAQSINIALPHKFQVPEDKVPRRLKPTDDMYNLADVTEYRLKQLPSDDVCKKLQGSMRLSMHGSIQLPSSLGKRLDYDASQEGVRNIYSWAKADDLALTEAQYDSEGYPIEGQRNTCESMFVSPQIRVSHKLVPAWDNQRFGREWFVDCRKGNVSPLQVAVVHSLLAIAVHPDLVEHIGNLRVNKAFWLLDKFTQNWTRLEFQSLGWATDTFSWLDHRHRFIQYHMRIFTIGGEEGLPSADTERGLPCRRVVGCVRSPDRRAVLPIVEERCTVALWTTVDMELPIFTIINISDCRKSPYPLSQVVKNQSQGAWKDANIHPCMQYTGIAAFLFRIYTWCDIWAHGWSTLLAGIDSVLAVELEQVLSEERRREMMFDNSSTFSSSESYFATIQLLRIAAEWIQESMESLKILGAEWNRMPNDGPTLVLRENWKSVIAYQEQLGDILLKRIAKKREELTSLRDGIFNATSINEATKSTQLNHYVFVFTIVTIFYLPLSFVVALFALGLFKWEEPRQKSSFITTIITVACGTYLFASFLIWRVRKRRGQELFREMWAPVRTVLRELFHRIFSHRRKPAYP